MKTIPETIRTVEVPNEGLIALLNQNVLIFCVNYFYYGKLVGVNDTCIKIENCYIIYETGSFAEDNFKDKQLLAPEWYVQKSAIESFGKSTKN